MAITAGQKVRVQNKASMDIQFKINVGGLDTGYTDYFPAEQSRTLSVDTSVIQSGAPMTVSVHAEAGATRHRDDLTVASSGTIELLVTGTSQQFTVSIQ